MRTQEAVKVCQRSRKFFERAKAKTINGAQPLVCRGQEPKVLISCRFVIYFASMADFTVQWSHGFLFVRFGGKHGDLGRRTKLGQGNTYLTLLCDWGVEMRARAPFAGESLCWKITAASIHKFGFGSDSFSCIYAGELDAVVCSLSSLPIHCVEKFALVRPHSCNLVQKILSACGPLLTTKKTNNCSTFWNWALLL